MTWGYESLKEIVEFISQEDTNFFGFLIVASIFLTFVVKMTDIVVKNGIIKILKYIFSGIGTAFEYIFKENKK